MSIGLTELRRLKFADAMYEVLFPRSAAPRGQVESMYEYLWKQIVDQELRPGDRVVDAAIAEAAGVSRTPVREAIQRLIQDGLLEELPRGVRVARPAPEEVAHLYDYRIALETFAARQAALAVPPAEVERLLKEGRSLRARLRLPGAQHDPQVAVDFVRYDVGLHQWLIQAGGNPYLAQAMAAVRGRLVMFTVHGTRVPGWMEQRIGEHEAILHALLARDAASAAATIGQHIGRAKQRVLRAFFGVAWPDAPDTELVGN